ncbi:MAG: hypothetical protein K2X02_08645 [Alphaproteobacteria bacterium]|nr:hypothetical protein [Alphaproteobacteria bacterium]
MSIDKLRQRYLNIVKNVSIYLKEIDFKKRGTKYIKQNANIILEIYFLVPRPWMNSDSSYEFEVWWNISSTDLHLMELSIFMGAKKNIKEAYLLGLNIIPDHLMGKARTLGNEDSSNFDQKYIEGIKNKIDTVVLPLFNRIHSIDDVIHIAEEEEAKLERKDRKFFPYAIYADLARFYAAKGWKDKALEMCNKHMERMTTPGSRKLAEERKKKYIKYFEKYPELIKEES